MKKTMAKEAVKELTLILMYLTRFSDQDRFSASENSAWKGYSFKALDSLEESGFINQGSHRSKSVHIYYEGLQQARALLEKYGIEDWDD
ncbi:MAG TPA: transposase [Clostridiales bacterium]|nr:transposase [Clostridiales bacterium]